ncbi:tRNA pseudouridine38/39 synthase, partial [Tremellales sp. Uapishka_1]
MSRYAQLTKEELIARLEALAPTASTSKTVRPVEDSASSSTSVSEVVQKRKPSPAPKTFNFNSHATRHVALLVSYHGWPYSGLALQSTDTPLPTVEGELMKALEKTRLIEEGKGWDGCVFSRCGRTDRGVSGEGQVVDLWLRTNRASDDGGADMGEEWKPALEPVEAEPRTVKEGEEDPNEEPPKKKAMEFSYPRILNSVLPPSIRILAWSPLNHPFSSRFSCQSRHYRYAFHLRPSLDLDLMTRAADLLIGEHDFRNFCKVDGSKQIENHTRGVLKAYFERQSDELMVFNLIGTAFLWHQVRHIIAILFLVGSKLESPDIVTRLLNTGLHPGLSAEKIIESKPNYQMGSPLPLTLHSCEYAPSTVEWRYGCYDGLLAHAEADDDVDGARDVLERGLEAQKQEAEIRAWQVGGALRRLKAILGESEKEQTSVLYPIGGGETIAVKKYQPLLSRPRADTPEVTNRKWREGGGERRRLRKEAEEAEGED